MGILQKVVSISCEDSEIGLEPVGLRVEVEEVSFFVEEACVFEGMFRVSHEKGCNA